MDHAHLYSILACLVGFLMTWGVGANDLANVMSPAMGSKSIPVRPAIIIAVVFEFLGAFLAGDHVTDTLRSGIIDTSMLADAPVTMVNGMLAVLFAGMTWMLIASYFGLPVSITHTIVGSITGFGLVELGVQALHLEQVGYIAISWVVSPVLSGILAYLMFLSVQQLILARRKPLIRARRYAPYYLFFIGFVLSTLTIHNGIEHFGIYPTQLQNAMISVGAGLFVLALGSFLIRRLDFAPNPDRHQLFEQVESIFSVLMFFTCGAMVFAHGSNDVANAVGPMSVVLTIVASGKVAQTGDLPLWILTWGCVGVVVGFLMYGRRVIETVGSGITDLTPSRAFCATISAAMTVVFATSSGIPVSATQTLVGAILGVGFARGIGALNMTVIRNIFMSWSITIPVGATLTITYYFIFKFLLGDS